MWIIKLPHKVRWQKKYKMFLCCRLGACYYILITKPQFTFNLWTGLRKYITKCLEMNVPISNLPCLQCTIPIYLLLEAEQLDWKLVWREWQNRIIHISSSVFWNFFGKFVRLLCNTSKSSFCSVFPCAPFLKEWVWIERKRESIFGDSPSEWDWVC